MPGAEEKGGGLCGVPLLPQGLAVASVGSHLGHCLQPCLSAGRGLGAATAWPSLFTLWPVLPNTANPSLPPQAPSGLRVAQGLVAFCLEAAGLLSPGEEGAGSAPFVQVGGGGGERQGPSMVIGWECWASGPLSLQGLLWSAAPVRRCLGGGGLR